MEALDLAAGLGVIGAGVVRLDAEAVELGLEDHAAFAWCAAEDGGVVAEELGRIAVALSSQEEGLEHVWSPNCSKGNRGETKPRVVVDLVEDLDVAAVGQLPVSGVGLPHLVGQLGLKANPRGPRALLRLRCDQAVRLQDSPDGRPRWRAAR